LEWHVCCRAAMFVAFLFQWFDGDMLGRQQGGAE
jgi:hypothetical protein